MSRFGGEKQGNLCVPDWNISVLADMPFLFKFAFHHLHTLSSFSACVFYLPKIVGFCFPFAAVCSRSSPPFLRCPSNGMRETLVPSSFPQ